MISFKTISHFRERLLALTSYKRGVYANAEKEVKQAFAGMPDTQLLRLLSQYVDEGCNGKLVDFTI